MTGRDGAVLAPGALYFALVFAAGWVLGPVRELLIVPHVGRTAGVLLEAPLMVVVIIVAARWTMRRFAVSSTLGTRAAIGLVALGLLLTAEVVGTLWVRGLSILITLEGLSRSLVASRSCCSCSSR
jgi:hypothetical protein